MTRTLRSLIAVVATLVVALLATTLGLVMPAANAQPAFAYCGGFEVTIDIGAGQVPTSGNDVIMGTQGNDAIAAGAGDDVICGIGGNDTIFGQAGNDLIYGEGGDDKLRGGDGADVILGGDGVDDINGGRDDDWVHGGDGNDKVVRGGTGNDYVVGGDGNDQIVAGNGGEDAVFGGDGDDALISGGPRKDELFGGSGDDVLKGLGGADRMFGDSGNDELRGGAQPDLLDGGAGTDLCNGGIQDDRAMNCETSEIVETQIPPAINYTTKTDVACPIDGPANLLAGVQCSLIKVPEDDTDPANGRTVEIMVAFIDNGDPSGVGPIVSLTGGPGGSELDSAPFYVGGPYDFLLVDQRGIGDSRPSLDCTEIDALFAQLQSVDNATANTLSMNAELACANRLKASGVSLGDVNTEQIADDFELIRQAMGFGQWNLFGVSYGTRLGLTIARDHPEGVRSLTIDAILPIEHDAIGRLDPDFFDALETLFASCAASVPCTSAYGDLEQLLINAFNTLQASPQTVMITRPSGEQIPVTVDGLGFLYNQIHSTMYVKQFIPEIPRWISLAAQGNVTEITELLTPTTDPQSREFSEGMFRAVMCQDEDVFVTATTGFWAQVCPNWVADTDVTNDKTPATGSVPTLVMSGSFDPITRPYAGRQVADSLSNATFVEFTDGGHGSSGDCAFALQIAFVENPGQSLNTSCADVGGPNFTVGGSPGRPIAAMQAELSGAAQRSADLSASPFGPIQPPLFSDMLLKIKRAEQAAE